MGRLARLAGLALVGAVVALGTVYLVVPLAARLFVRAITLTAAGCVWLATSISMGVSVWTMCATMWQTATGALATPTASLALWGLVAVGGGAVYWLQRLLGSEEE